MIQCDRRRFGRSPRIAERGVRDGSAPEMPRMWGDLRQGEDVSGPFSLDARVGVGRAWERRGSPPDGARLSPPGPKSILAPGAGRGQGAPGRVPGARHVPRGGAQAQPCEGGLGQPGWRITGTPESHGSYDPPIEWTMTATDVIEGGIDGYRDNMRAWARSILASFRHPGIGSAPRATAAIARRLPSRGAGARCVP